MVTEIRTLFILMILTCFLTGPVSAKTFWVNSGFDANDLDPGNGLCVAYILIFPPFVFPFCTLRAAIEETNSLPGHDTIELPSGSFSLEILGPEEDNGACGDLDILDSLTIQGRGPEQTIIDGRFIDRVFDIRAPHITVTLQDLSIINGRIENSGAVEVSGGGALRNRGKLTVKNAVSRHHQVAGGGVHDQGGILHNDGAIAIISSTLGQGRANQGGAIYNSSAGVMQIVSSTLAGNDAVVGAAVSNNGHIGIINSTISTNGTSRTRYGGGLDNSHVLSLEYATVAHNQALYGGGSTTVVYSPSATALLHEIPQPIARESDRPPRPGIILTATAPADYTMPVTLSPSIRN